jgi:hypothetical protein
MTNPDTIIFLHIPKTAGTTLNRIFQQQYKPQQLHTWGPRESIEAYQQLPIEEKEAIRLISGHTAYGIHELVPGTSTYITFLRDPVQRVVSFYHFVKNNDQHYLYNHVVDEFKGIKPFVSSGITPMVDNGQTRFISGAWPKPGFGELTSHHFEQAKANLDQSFTVVGLTEQFDKTLLLLQDAFNWQNINYVRQNVTKTKPQERSLTPEERETILALNQWDIPLYEYACARFEQQIAALGPDFSRRLETFQRQNKLHQKIKGPLLQSIHWAKQFSVRTAVRGIFSP